MVVVLPKRLPVKAVLAATVLLFAAARFAQGQYPPPGAYPMPAGMYPSCGMNYGVMPAAPIQPYYFPPHPCLPGPVPPSGQPAQPGQSAPPGESAQPTQPSDSTGSADTSARDDFLRSMDTAAANAGMDPSLPGEQGAAGGGDSLALVAPGGYLDNPIPISTFRLRFDSAFDDNRPDRAEYLYGAWKELGFHPHGVQGGGVFFDPKAMGPTLLPGYVNYQIPEAYFEYAFLKRFSAFVQVPYRTIQFHNLQEDFPEAEQKRNAADQPNAGSKFFPEPGPEGTGSPQTNFNGFSDMQFGFKAALLASPKQYLTFQLRLYSPTGDPGLGLGTGHWSVEPSLLLYERLTKRLVLQGQLTEWTPIDGGVAGNILQYGVGLGYAVYQRGNFAIMPTAEFMGWTVLNGYESVFAPISATAPPGTELPLTHGVEEAGGNTIVNGKFGTRFFFGGGSSLFVGYGRALTGTHWYTDDFRVEYRLFFGRNKRLFRSL
jgi:hypothetical protein